MVPSEFPLREALRGVFSLNASGRLKARAFWPMPCCGGTTPGHFLAGQANLY
jgi:hypothetical protein